MNQLVAWLDQLEQELTIGSQGLWKRTDTDACLDLVVRIRRGLPEIIAQAQEIVDIRADILESARQTSEQMIADAERRAQDVCRESVLLKRAESSAKSIKEDAVLTARKILEDNRKIILNMHDALRSFLSELDKQSLESGDRFKVAPREKTSTDRRSRCR